MKLNNLNPRTLIGIIFIFFGGMLLLENLDLFNFRFFPVIFSFQMFIVVIGLIIYLNSKDRTGIALMAFGGFLLLLKIFHISISLWPLILIALGVYIIFSLNKKSTSVNQFKDEKSDFENTDFNNEDFINDIAIFGGVEKSFASDKFRGGKVTAIFGGCEIDLQNCTLAKGKNSIEVLAMFGGITLVIPKDWKVIVEVTPIFGGFSDSRKKDPSLISDEDKIIVIKGIVIFGGGEIK